MGFAVLGLTLVKFIRVMTSRGAAGALGARLCFSSSQTLLRAGLCRTSADFAKSKVSNELGREAIDAAEAAAKKMIGDGRRMHGMGHSGGVRLSGRGHCSGSGMPAVHGSGMRAVGHRRGSGMRIPHPNE